MANLKLEAVKDKFIYYYNENKTDLWIAQKLGVGERTVQRYAQYLREVTKEIKPRASIVQKQKFNLEEVKDEDYSEMKEKAKTKWNIKKSKIKKVKKPFKTYLLMGDHHVPEHDVSANKAIFNLMDNIAFDGIVIGGDFMNMGPISHWDQHKKKKLETKRMKLDYIEGNALLDEYDKRLPNGAEKYYIYGNHEQWYFQLIEQLPVLDGFFHPTEELKLKERGYTVYEDENHIMKLGRLYITHGIYCNVHATHKHIVELKTNVAFFHTHRLGARTETSPAKEIAIVGYNIPCLCNMNPAFMKNMPNKWTHGFGILYVYDNGYFDVDIKRIVKGKFVYNNKLYDGNK